jgi:hypothetical protein
MALLWGPDLKAANTPDRDTFNVRAFGAMGDGKALDSPRIKVEVHFPRLAAAWQTRR